VTKKHKHGWILQVAIVFNNIYYRIFFVKQTFLRDTFLKRMYILEENEKLVVTSFSRMVENKRWTEM